VCTIGGGAFEEKSPPTPRATRIAGAVRVFSSLSNFKSANKQTHLASDFAASLITVEGRAAAAQECSLSLSLHCYVDLKAQRVFFWSAFPAVPIQAVCQIVDSCSSAQVSGLVAGVCIAHESSLQIPWHVRNSLHALRKADPDAHSFVLRFSDDMAVQFDLVDAGDAQEGLVGWLPDRHGRMLPRLVRLGSASQGAALAKQASDLNLSLMKWQAAPGVQLGRIAGFRALLLGAGTLGCNVARGLVGWGISDITLLDYGTVSMSNPTRQPLFTFEDAKARAPKAQAAAAALLAVQPAASVRGHTFSIPMPGHHSTRPKHEVVQQVEQLQAYIQAADVVFLLTDSRESRWLPSLLCSMGGVPLINVALGFDTCLVMRHAGSSSETGAPPCGCYFCSDIVVPTDSSGNRTLDQQCTVTRPGLAAWASAMAVELMVNTLHNEEQFSAGGDAAAGSMGDVPHTLRCDISTFTVQKLQTHAFAHCSACSPAIVQAATEGGNSLIADLLMNTVSISQVCGLDEYYAQAETAAAAWQEEELQWE